MIAELFLILRCLGPRIAGHDAVDERAGDDAVIVHPGLELRLEIPELDVLVDAVLEVLAVMVDELDRQHDEALVMSTVERLESAIEELGQLGRIGFRRRIGQFLRALVYDAGLSRVRYDELQRIDIGQRDHLLIVAVGAYDLIDAFDDAVLFIGFAVLIAAQADGIEILLLFEEALHAGAVLLDRDDEHRAGVEAIGLIGAVYTIVDKRAQEIALAELDEFYRMFFRRIEILDIFHDFAPSSIYSSAQASQRRGISRLPARLFPIRH